MDDHPLWELSRRQFLATSGAAVLGSALAVGDEPAPPQAPAVRSRVVLVRDAAVLDDKGQIQQDVLARMLDQAVTAVVGAPDAPSAWKQIVADAGSVGIKTNAWRMLPTPPQLERLLRERLAAAGIAGDRIVVDDRGALRTLAGCDALINVRPLRTHYWAGIGGCIKNYIMFSEEPAAWHPDGCADLGGLLNLPVVKGKSRLHILVVLTPLFHGKGPHHFDPRFVWPYKGLIVSADPVSADSTGVRLLVAKRRLHFREDVPFETHTVHVELAETRHHAGVADASRIELVRLGWQEEMLI